MAESSGAALTGIIAIYDDTLAGLRARRDETTDRIGRVRIELAIAEAQSARNQYQRIALHSGAVL
jgi:hypothetical protein